MNRLLIPLVTLTAFLLSGCSINRLGLPSASTSELRIDENSQPDRTLTIFAAASLTEAFKELGEAFEASHPGVQVKYNFAGSQILRTQLEQGAVVDLFASADQDNMQILAMENIVEPESVQDFSGNRMIVILPPGNPAGVETLADLARPGLKLILADASVPAGFYARQVFSSLSEDPGFGADYGSTVLTNVVSNELDVRQVVTKVELGEADAGVVYASDAFAIPDLFSLVIPDEFNIQASYPIAILSRSPEPHLAAEFIDHVLSPEGQAILSRWGFIPGKKQ